jgi:hypothetical protein
VNREQSLRALEVLASSPAARWIGNKFLPDGKLLQKMPPAIRGPADVPVGFDEKLFTWKRAFQVAHESCVAPDVDSAFDKGGTS